MAKRRATRVTAPTRSDIESTLNKAFGRNVENLFDTYSLTMVDAGDDPEAVETARKRFQKGLMIAKDALKITIQLSRSS